MARCFRTISFLTLALAGPLVGAQSIHQEVHARVVAPRQVPGTVVDLSLDSSGLLLYCTLEGDVGRISVNGARTVLATQASAGFDSQPTAVVEGLAGEVFVLTSFGNIWRVAPGPATLIYDDVYMVIDATDLVIDAGGNFLIASATPSNQRRGINWISPDGQRWAYFMVRHTPTMRWPIQLANDPSTGSLLMADQKLGGVLSLVDTTTETHPLTEVDTTTLFGFMAANEDGDMAVQTDGEVLTIAGGDVYRTTRGAGTSSVIASGFDQLRGIAIAASSGEVASPSGWSAYVAEGAFPTEIREIPDVGAPAGLVLPDQGSVPGRGFFKDFFGTVRVYELSTDIDGHLLVGGELWGADFQVKRIELPSLNATIVADDSDGLGGRIEGIVSAADGTIYASDSFGRIYSITEDPLVVTTEWSDPMDVVSVAKDLALDQSGSWYLADRESWGFGEVREVQPGGTTISHAGTQETRGLAPDPTTGGLFVAEWVNTGFEGKVTLLDIDGATKTDVPGFVGMNFTNASTWGDGDIVVDADGNVYAFAEDDWALHRYDPTDPTGTERIGSGYLNHPSGLTIAASTETSSTGWSLYVAEFDFLWEIPNVPAPGPTILDATGPPAGRMFGYTNPSHGKPLTMISDPGGNGLLIGTAKGRVLHMDALGTASLVADGLQGLSGEIRALAPLSDGRVLAANEDGLVVELDPSGGWSWSVRYDDATDVIGDLRTVVVDGLDRVFLIDGPGSSKAGRMFRLDGSTPTLVAFTRGGVGAAVDPLSADVFVTETGSVADGGGELLRVETFGPQASTGHYRGDSFYLFEVEPQAGALAFDALGDVFVAEGGRGRVSHVDRATGARTDIGGNYVRPRAVALAPGSNGEAGVQGTSLFVLDQWRVWEIGVDGLPAGAPPASPPGLADPADLRVTGLTQLGGQVSVDAEAPPGEEGKLYVVFPSYDGKVPGVPLNLFGNPADTRVIPNNPDFLWSSVGDETLFPSFTGYLDAQGRVPAGTGVMVPNIPEVISDAFIDFAWVVVDSTAPGFISHVGGTAQLYMGL